jgi:hypothetical protein
MYEANDIFAIANGVPAFALCSYGFLTPGVFGGLCFGAGLGITLFGIAYMYVHDGRGLHSSTIQRNSEPFLTQKHTLNTPNTPHHPLNTPETIPNCTPCHTEGAQVELKFGLV